VWGEHANTDSSKTQVGKCVKIRITKHYKSRDFSVKIDLNLLVQDTATRVGVEEEDSQIFSHLFSASFR